MAKCTDKFLKPSSTITLSLLALAGCFLTPGPLHCAATMCPGFHCLLGVHFLDAHLIAMVTMHDQIFRRKYSNLFQHSFKACMAFVVPKYSNRCGRLHSSPGGELGFRAQQPYFTIERRRRLPPHAKWRVARYFRGRRTQTTQIFATFARFSRHHCSLGRIFRYFLVRFSA